ncbi:hypothetical protein ZWY2020_026173 [Hordeum vulgare]|nr:hypothetical protein ZWY2020_026173 [Hordeum vulgare]
MTESIVRNMPGMVNVKDMPLLQDGCKPMDAEDYEDYTDVFFIKFAQVSDARNNYTLPWPAVLRLRLNPSFAAAIAAAARCKPMDAEDCEDYTDVFFIKFAQVSDAR